MNCTYRSIFNEKTGTFVAVSENATSAGKKTSSCTRASNAGARFTLQALAVSVMLSVGGAAFASPSGGVVTAGSANITTGANNTTITQSTQNAAINWLSFNIGTGEAVRFVQPNSNSVTLNRVLGSDPSSILGTLSANGKVFLVNPNGVLFGQGASVNVGGLVASTLNVTDNDFMAANYKFAGTSNGAVVNQGAINADGGYVALLGANVANNGVITAKLGTVALAAGNAMTLDVAGDGLLNVTVNQGVVNALVQNGGLIQADGGQVLLTAQAAGNLLSSAVNNTGVIQAQTLQNHQGVIKLMGGMQNGSVNVGGTLDASAPNGGDGGFIETSAAHVKVADNVNITTLASAGKTGNWLIDPVDYTVAATGDIAGSTLSANLVSSNVTILSGNGTHGGTLGNVNVNEAVSWSGTTTLTLDAVNDVNINAAIIASTTGSVVASAGHDVNVAAAITATTGHLTFNAVNDVAISAATTITTGNMTAVAGHDVKVSAASTITTGDMIFIAGNDGTGPGVAAGTVSITCGSNCLTITTGNLKIRFNPVTYASTGTEITAYRANLTGAGVLDAKAWVFGQGDNKMYDGTTAATVSGFKADTAGVAPAVALGTVTNAVFDTRDVGTAKLITYNSTLTDPVYALFAPFDAAPGSYTTRADILVRPLTINAVTDTRVYNGSTSSTGTPTVVALQPGDTLTGPLTQSYTSKDVLGTGASTLVATGPYTVADGNGGNNYVVSVNTAPGTITPLALVGAITAANKVYDANNTATITSRTLAGVIGADTVSYTGGSATFNDKNVADGKAVTGTGLALAGTDAGNYTVNTTAATTANVTPLAITGAITAADKVYDANTTATITSRTLSGTVAGDTVSYTGGTANFNTPDVGTGKPVTGTGLALAGTDAGNYTVNTTAATTANVTPLAITGAITAANKVYDGNNSATITSRTLAGVIGGDTVSYTGGTATFNDKNVADGKAVTGTGLALAGTDAGNYTVNSTAATTANVTPLAITGAITAADKVYDSTTAATITSRTLSGTVVGDTVSYTGGTATFNTPDVGTGKPVTGTGLALAGTDAGNYTVNSTAATTAAIIAPFAAPPVTTTAVPPGMTPVGWVPTITPGRTPPQLTNFVPPVAVVVTPPVAQYVAPVEQPVVVQEQLPIVAAVEKAPEVYVAPHRVRKQDRN